MMFLAHLMWGGVTVYGIWRMAQVLERFAPPKKVAVEDAEEPKLPEDLIAYALSFSESWAQEDCLKALRQNYEKWKDWNRVRAAMGIGRLEQ